MTVDEAITELKKLSDNGFGDSDVVRTDHVWGDYEDLNDFSFLYDGDEDVVCLEFVKR